MVEVDIFSIQYHTDDFVNTQICFQELEKRFSETGAYKNLKKMLASKNDTIKELRKKISTYEPSNDEIKEEE